MLHAAGNVTVLDSTSIPLGVEAETLIVAAPPLNLQPGDIMTFFTDGVVEAESAGMVRFGVGRALEVIRSERDQPAVQIITALHEEVVGFCRYQPQQDDMTVVIVKTLANNPGQSAATTKPFPPDRGVTRMTRILSACFVAAVVAAWCGSARADLCEKCRNLMFTDSAGTCCNCGGKTSSAALKLCGRCSAALHRCERCMAPLDANAGPLPSTNPSLNWRHSSDLADTAPSTPTPTPNSTPTPTPNQLGSPGAAPATPTAGPVRAIKRIDPNKSGVYLEGKWKFQLDITSPGTRNEARMGWLFYDGKKPPRRRDQRLLPHALGTHLLGWPPATLSGLHGWMPFRSRQVNRTGRELALAPAQPPALAPAPAKPAMPKPQWFQVGKAENGKRLQVPVGQYVLVRLLGNPTTGYQWQTAGVTGRSLQSLAADPQYVPAPSKPGMVGSGGTYNFKFHADRPGTTTIKLVYVRPWEKNRPAVDMFMCTIDVAAPRPAAPATGNAARGHRRGRRRRPHLVIPAAASHHESWETTHDASCKKPPLSFHRGRYGG